MAPRLSVQISIFGVDSFVFKSLLEIEGQMKLEKFAILTRKPRSHAGILIYRTWPIGLRSQSNTFSDWRKRCRVPWVKTHSLPRETTT